MEVIAKLKQGYHFLDHSVQLDVSTIFSVFLWLRVYVCVLQTTTARWGLCSGRLCVCYYNNYYYYYCSHHYN